MQRKFVFSLQILLEIDPIGLPYKHQTPSVASKYFLRRSGRHWAPSIYSNHAPVLFFSPSLLFSSFLISRRWKQFRPFLSARPDQMPRTRWSRLISAPQREGGGAEVVKQTLRLGKLPQISSAELTLACKLGRKSPRVQFFLFFFSCFARDRPVCKWQPMWEYGCATLAALSALLIVNSGGNMRPWIMHTHVTLKCLMPLSQTWIIFGDDWLMIMTRFLCVLAVWCHSRLWCLDATKDRVLLLQLTLSSLLAGTVWWQGWYAFVSTPWLVFTVWWREISTMSAAHFRRGQKKLELRQVGTMQQRSLLYCIANFDNQAAGLYTILEWESNSRLKWHCAYKRLKCIPGENCTHFPSILF